MAFWEEEFACLLTLTPTLSVWCSLLTIPTTVYRDKGSYSFSSFKLWGKKKVSITNVN
jgi:hypothetical protein